MPNLIYNLEFKIDKSQLAELKNIVDASTTAEVSALTDKVKKLEKQLSTLKNTENEINKTDKQRLKSSKSRRSQINALLTLGRQKGTLDKDELKTLRNLTNAHEQETNAIKEVAFADGKSIVAKEKLSNELKQSTVAIGNATEALEVYENQQKKTTQAVLGGDKSFSIANQTLFGFGDLAQDAAQFSQGPAQGFRAIGNNIAFNAEMFGLLVQKTGSAKAAFKTLGSQILGTGGIILGLNVAITVLTGLLTRTDKKAREAKESLGDLGSEAELAFKAFDDFAGVLDVQSESLLPKLSDVIEKNINVLQKEKDKLGEVKDARDVLNRLLVESEFMRQDESESIVESITSKTKEINQLKTSIAARESESSIVKSVSKETVDAILERVKAFEKEEEIRKAIQSLLADELKAAEDAKKAALFQKESITTNIDIAQKELDIINSSNELQKTQLQAELQRFKIREDLATRKKEIDELELDDEQKKTLRLQEEALARIELEKVTAQESIEIKKQQEEAKLEIEKRNAEISKNIEKEKLEIRKKIGQGMLNLAQSFAKKNEGVAFALLALEKAKAISEVIIKSKQKIFDVSADAIANPAAAPAILAQIPLIKANAAATIAAITAQGIKQAGSVGGGATGGGATGGGGSSAQSQQRGFSETAFIGGNQRFDPQTITPSFDPSNPESMGATIVLQGSLDEEVMAYKVKSGNAKIESGTTYLGD